MTIRLIPVICEPDPAHPPLCDMEDEIVVMLDMLTESELRCVREMVAGLYRSHIN